MKKCNNMITSQIGVIKQMHDKGNILSKVSMSSELKKQTVYALKDVARFVIAILI